MSDELERLRIQNDVLMGYIRTQLEALLGPEEIDRLDAATGHDLRNFHIEERVGELIRLGLKCEAIDLKVADVLMSFTEDDVAQVKAAYENDRRLITLGKAVEARIEELADGPQYAWAITEVRILRQLVAAAAEAKP